MDQGNNYRKSKPSYYVHEDSPTVEPRSKVGKTHHSYTSNTASRQSRTVQREVFEVISTTIKERNRQSASNNHRSSQHSSTRNNSNRHNSNSNIQMSPMHEQRYTHQSRDRHMSNNPSHAEHLSSHQRSHVTPTRPTRVAPVSTPNQHSPNVNKHIKKQHHQSSSTLSKSLSPVSPDNFSFAMRKLRSNGNLPFSLDSSATSVTTMSTTVTTTVTTTTTSKITSPVHPTVLSSPEQSLSPFTHVVKNKTVCPPPPQQGACANAVSPEKSKNSPKKVEKVSKTTKNKQKMVVTSPKTSKHSIPKRKTKGKNNYFEDFQ